MNPNAPAPVLKARWKTVWPVLYIVAGGLFLLLALIALTQGGISLYLILGPLLLAMGILSLTMPIYSYEPPTGAFYMHHPFGYRMRTWGAPKGERLWWDGTNLMRILPDGKQKRVKLNYGRPEEVGAIVQAIAAQQQAQ